VVSFQASIIGRRTYVGISVESRFDPLDSKLHPKPPKRPWMAVVHTTMLRCWPGFPPELAPSALVAAPELFE
jgi:hypothetical protein